MTLTDVTNAVYTKVKELPYPIVYPNRQGVVAGCVSVHILPMDTGVTVDGVLSQRGLIQVNCFVDIGVGEGVAHSMADVVVGLFRDSPFGGLLIIREPYPSVGYNFNDVLFAVPVTIQYLEE